MQATTWRTIPAGSGRVAITAIAYSFDSNEAVLYLVDTLDDWREARTRGIAQGLLFTPRMVCEMRAAGLSQKDACAAAYAKALMDSKVVAIINGKALTERREAQTVPNSFEAPTKVAKGKRR